MKSLHRITQTICLLLTLLLPTARVAAADASPPKGALVIAGGALRAETASVWTRIVALAGGKGARIAVFPAAAASPIKSGERTMATLAQYGAAPFLVPISPRIAGADFGKLADDEAIATQVASADGVFFTGGDQGRITQVLLRKDGSNTRVLDAVWEVYRKGGVVAGTSAGAAIMSTTMFYEADSILDTLRQGVREGKEISRGLGFIGPDVFIDQHVLARGRFARMLVAMQTKGYKLGLGVDEDTAMILSSDGVIEVAGNSGVVMIDLASATSERNKPEFNLRNARLSYLAAGDRLDLASRAVTPSASKLGGARIDHTAPGFKPHNTEARFYPDALGYMTLAVLLKDFIGNKQETVRALAFSTLDEEQSELGYEFRFSKGKGTLGYFTDASGVDDYTVLDVCLDVIPVVMQVPLYRYR